MIYIFSFLICAFSATVTIGHHHSEFAVLRKQYPKLTRQIHRITVRECKLQNVGKTHKLTPGMVYALIQGESEFTLRAVSRAGARGLMQVMPYHFSRGENPFELNTNIREGIGYFLEAWQRAHRWVGANSKTDYSKQHVKRYREAVRMYNAGHYNKRWKYRNWRWCNRVTRYYEKSLHPAAPPTWSSRIAILLGGLP